MAADTERVALLRPACCSAMMLERELSLCFGNELLVGKRICKIRSDVRETGRSPRRKSPSGSAEWLDRGLGVLSPSRAEPQLQARRVEAFVDADPELQPRGGVGGALG
ncbi:uncharacterized protein L3040_002318 [Drepanopeziza brunnea f. sp. 'multigermtubi']|uniref:Uncharacterized protein n=1 Tax=Marssonina brunnea f. sp. multigermtubi (strain MB_m1) TaxID=1072389 RepID=K1Y490_MARBU|nr:uncharacterized protein MBM_01956 [Drepanopeziza brunnea f. sp. 'multigermtubi' MB_m1]EKD20004.1 hypothetical protein MBM_01956 [Drepanopeziza brunnea f. sp. 'multigermtubi' MB_m1]KAJ5050435.1 hypothetical protein L3040_002318 [Drepanopeziza brunnea f. sp. 'multigermtubi']